jgi:hypothetical protein
VAPFISLAADAVCASAGPAPPAITIASKTPRAKILISISYQFRKPKYDRRKAAYQHSC